MPRYEHLSLRRLEGALERRKFGGGSPPKRDARVHGAAIQQELETAIENQKIRPAIANIDPALILKIKIAGPVDEKDWANLGLTVLASDPDKTLVLFASDSQLVEFRRRVVAYQQEPPEGNKHPQFSGFVSAIEEVGEIAARDRIGPVLRNQGINEPADFPPDRREVLDVELWQPDSETARIFTYRVARRLAELGGRLINEYRGPAAVLMRVEGDGNAIRALLELPEVLMIDRPPEPDLPDLAAIRLDVGDVPEMGAPPVGALTIGIVDSGISAQHPLLAKAMVGSFGAPARLGDDDQKGHGTQVGGIAVYGDIRHRLAQRDLAAQFSLASAKVVNDLGKFDSEELVPAQMDYAIRRLHGEFGCRVINISLGDRLRPASSKPSSWAAVLDDLARELDLVIVISAGNSASELLAAAEGHGVAGYPTYLLAASNRILEPSTAFNAITVGSLAHSNGLSPDDRDLVGVRPIAQSGQPSPFTRVGPGAGKIIKPDLVDYGGTLIFDGATQHLMGGDQREAAGMLTLNHRYLEQLFAARSGTSFASALVAYKAAALRQAFENASADLIKALLVLSAEIPDASSNIGFDDDAILQVFGYGVADLDHAISSDDNRVVLYREDTLAIDRFAIFAVPIPGQFQTERGMRHIRVALSFTPPVRHTRLDYAGISMSFRLLRGATSEEAFDHCRKWSKAEGTPFKLRDRFNCSMAPGPQVRDRGCLQRAVFTAQRDMSEYTDVYYLVVRCEGGWAADLVDEQRFAVAVELQHEAEIGLYQRIQERIRIQPQL